LSEVARYSYIHGSAAEGVIVYDNNTKIHSHHDTDPARGQHNAFDLVRLHRFGDLDQGSDPNTPVTDLPSFKKMLEFAASLPEVQAERHKRLIREFPDESPYTEKELTQRSALTEGALARPIGHLLKNPTKTRWLLKDILEQEVIAVLAGKRGSYKSFVSLDWTLQSVALGHTAYVISAEGGDYDRRARAWLQHHRPDLVPAALPLYVVERRLDLNSKEGVDLIREDCKRLGIHPALFVLDTFSKLSGGLEENDNSEVKQFIGRLDNGLKRKETGFGASVLVVAHTGHGDQSRARGASAFGADTDAEYIVARVGGNEVRISRERFKASPELEPLYLRAVGVDLGYTDEQGDPVTSLAFEPVDLGRVKRPRDSKVRGVVQKLVMDVATPILQMGEAEAKVLVKATVEQMVPDLDAKRDSRPQSVRKAIDGLVSAGLLFMHPGSRLSLTRVPELRRGEFDAAD